MGRKKMAVLLARPGEADFVFFRPQGDIMSDPLAGPYRSGKRKSKEARGTVALTLTARGLVEGNTAFSLVPTVPEGLTHTRDLGKCGVEPC